jgi:hypothetical protein
MTMLAVRIVSIVSGLLAFRGIRWAYITYIVIGLLYFPLQVGFQFHPHACQMGISLQLAWLSLGNWGHLVLFAIFYVMTIAQFRTRTWRTLVWAAVIVIAMGAAVEIAEGATGDRNCRLRDLVPDAAGALLGMALVAAWARLRD